MDNELRDQRAAAEDPLASAEPWNLIADGYTAEALPLLEKFARDALQLASLPPGSRILDVATGPGTLALLAAREGAMVSAIDFSPAMVANLRRRADDAGLTLADLRVGDGQALPYEDNSFDGAFSLFGLMFFPDRASGFGELWRVLRPGGRAVVSSFAALTGPFTLVIDGLRTMLPDLFSEEGEEPLPLSDPEQFRREMSAAGFSELTIRTITHSETTPSISEYWSKMQRSRVSIALFRRKLGEERWKEVAQGVLNWLQEALGDGPVEEVFTAHLGVGLRNGGSK